MARDGSASTKIDVAFFNPRVASWGTHIEALMCALVSIAPMMTDNTCLEDSLKISIAMIGVNSRAHSVMRLLNISEKI